MTFVYPRLDVGVALGQLWSLHGRDASDLRGEAAWEHTHATYYEAGLRVPTAQLELLANRVREAAAAHGYPDRAAKSAQREADRALGLALQEGLEGFCEQGVEAVWTFLAVVLLPDVVCWRWGWKQPSDGDEVRSVRRFFERYLGGHRNALRRDWHRVNYYGSGEKDAVNNIPEDAIVAIEERPSLGAQPHVARSIFEVIHSLDVEDGVSEDAVRNFARELRRLNAVRPLAFIPDRERHDLLEGLLVHHAALLR